MDAERGNQTIKAMQARNRSQTIVIFSLIAVIVGLIIILGSDRNNKQTMLQPPAKDSPSYIVGNNTANQQYFVDMADYYINSFYNVTPVNVKGNFETLLEATDPRSYPQMKKILAEAEARIVKEGITSVWSSTGAFKYEEAEKSVTVEGYQKTYLADRIVSEVPKKIKIQFTMDKGKISLYSMGEVKENNGNQ